MDLFRQSAKAIFGHGAMAAAGPLCAQERAAVD
jgi:hypothetical protein